MNIYFLNVLQKHEAKCSKSPPMVMHWAKKFKVAQKWPLTPNFMCMNFNGFYFGSKEHVIY